MDTSSASLPPSGTSSRSHGTKVGKGWVKDDEVIGVVRSLGDASGQAGWRYGKNSVMEYCMLKTYTG